MTLLRRLSAYGPTPSPTERQRTTRARDHLHATLADAEGEAYPTPQPAPCWPVDAPDFARCCTRRIVAPTGAICSFCGAIQSDLPASSPAGNAGPADATRQVSTVSALATAGPGTNSRAVVPPRRGHRPGATSGV